MKPSVLHSGLILVVVLACGAAEARPDAYAALGLTPQQVITGTVLNSKVLPGGRKQVVCVATYFTGKKDKAEAVNVRMGVFDEGDDGLVDVYRRDFGAENGGHVGNAEVQLLDLDRDGVNEIIVSYDDFREPLIEQRVAEIILYSGSRLGVAWTAPVEYDATKAVRDVPQERRDRYLREFDFVNTLRTRGVTLFVNKQVVAVAGQRLAEPKVVQETFELRPSRASW